MRVRLVSGLGLAAMTGCANFDSVEDACRDGVRGDQHGSDEAVDVIRRISCYRTFVGLDRGNIDKRITEAVAAHADYLGANAVLSTTGLWQYESPDTGGFTGEDAYARLLASEYLVEGATDAFIWEVLLPGPVDRTAEEMVDEVMIDPFARDALLAPGWEGSGYQEFADPALGALAYMNIVLYYPSGSRTTRPVIYPQDGQSDVPTSWGGYVSARSATPTTAGFPITFTLGSSRIVPDSTNPLGVKVLASTITGPSGPVAHTVLLPGTYTSGVNWSTAILVPTAPLEPSSVYTVTAELSSIDLVSREEELTFTTADE